MKSELYEELAKRLQDAGLTGFGKTRMVDSVDLLDASFVIRDLQSRLEQAEKDSARLKIILDAQDADNEECKFAVIKNANYDCYQSSSELIDAIDTAMQSVKKSQ